MSDLAEAHDRIRACRDRGGTELVHLETLWARQNRLRTLPEGLDTLTQLEDLDLACNPMSDDLLKAEHAEQITAPSD